MMVHSMRCDVDATPVIAGVLLQKPLHRYPTMGDP